MESMHELREVDFHKYCTTCKNKNIKDTDEPCADCLGNPIGIETSIPMHYKKQQ